MYRKALKFVTVFVCARTVSKVNLLFFFKKSSTIFCIYILTSTFKNCYLHNHNDIHYNYYTMVKNFTISIIPFYLETVSTSSYYSVSVFQLHVQVIFIAKRPPTFFSRRKFEVTQCKFW